MIQINTIQDFYSKLDAYQRYDVCNNLNMRARLDTFLEARNKLKREEEVEVVCENCHGSGKKKKSHRVDTDGYFHASSIGQCIRKIYYDVSGYKNQAESKINGQSYRTLDSGNAIHDLIQEYGYQGAFCEPQYYQAEVPIVPDLKLAESKGYHILPFAEKYNMKSFVDAILWNVEVNVRGLGKISVRVGHEYKTIGDKGFSGTEKFPGLSEPKQEHLWQAHIYMMIFNLPVMTFIYWNKDNENLKEFSIMFTQSIWNEVENKLKRIEEFKQQGTPPPFEETSARFKQVECVGSGRFSSCKYYGNICQPPQELIKIGGRKR